MIDAKRFLQFFSTLLVELHQQRTRSQVRHFSCIACIVILSLASWAQEPERSEEENQQFQAAERIPEALQQYQLLVASAPGNPDFLRDWGKLVLKDKSQEMTTRKAEATRIWNQIVAIRPDDASNLAQVADFFRQANLNDEAIALYRKAVDAAPSDPQYRVYAFFSICKALQPSTG